MFKGIRSLCVYVSDMNRAKEFYTKILGFKIRKELCDNLCFLQSRSGNIDIYLEGGNKSNEIDNQTCRLSFFLESEKSAMETYAELKRSDVELIEDEPECVGDNVACFQFKDPDGNILEVSGKMEI